MKRFIYISFWLLALIVGACFVACSDYDEMYMNQWKLENSPHIKLSIDVASENTTRANPQGGETGDGLENGVRNENKLYDVMVFFIRSNDGMDAIGSTTFLLKKYITNSDPEWQAKENGVDITFPTGDYVPQDNDRVIVIANAGDKLSSITNLETLRDYTDYQAWTGTSVADADRFVMSSAHNNDSEGRVSVTDHAGSKTDPFVSSLNIQRAAARIDFMYKTDNYTGTAPTSDLSYIVTKSTGSDQVGTVHLQNIIPVNMMQQPSYMIKRVTTNATSIAGSVKYASTELATSYVPTNYVVEPHSKAKEGTVADGTITDWYKTSRAANVKNNIASFCATSAKTGISDYVGTQFDVTDLSFQKAVTLAYTNENTQSKEKQLPEFMTGLLLKTVYVPAKVYSDYSGSTLTESTSYSQGTTFWRYKPTKAEMKEEDCLYFSNETAATAYKNAHPDDLADITAFTDGVCYYNLWIRHANVDNDPHETFPMEYGIVRNNIYRIGVEKFTGPGYPTPMFEGPQSVHLRIFVRPWNLRVHPEILL